MRSTSHAMLPGGMPAARFLARYWQRRALVVRAAMPDFTGTLSRVALFKLAARDDVQSRLVVRSRNDYVLEHGPFAPAALRSLPPTRWTLLVQGVNLHDAPTDALLRRFAFVPYARLDDVMVSLAAPGGGVGPHFDSYDVFLLQGYGRRRWRYGAQADRALRPGLPLRILRRFAPSHDAVLSPGDMLYVPPGYAHDGVALDECTTYSMGFRAPAHQEIVEAFVDRLRDTLCVAGRYADRGRVPTRHPARLDPAMLADLARPLARVRWTERDVRLFLGSFLSEPKEHITFDRPRVSLSFARFGAAAARRGVRLDLRTQLLYDARSLFQNGVAIALPASAAKTLHALADARALDAARCRALPDPALRIVHQSYRDGYLHLGAG